MRSDHLALVAALSALAVACSDASYTPPLVNAPPDAGDAATVDATPPKDAAAQETSAPFPGICNPTAPWIKPKSAGVSPSNAFLGAITPDELTIAWMEGTSLVWSDRKTAGDAWGPAQRVKIGAAASAHIALSANGLKVILVVASGRNFGQVTRKDKGEDFSTTVDSTPFTSFAFAMGEAPPAATLDDPLLAKDDLHFYFTLDVPNANATLRQSARAEATSPWTFGQPITQPELAPTNGKLRHPTGISTDRLTLFYWDEALAEERAAFRLGEDADFSIFVGLGARPDGKVDSACTHLYYTANDDFAYVTRQ
jgi:hypothetical protein